MSKRKNEGGEHEYTEDQRPCIVARKPCGCYCAAAGLDEDELLEIVKWEIGEDSDLPALVDFLKEAAPHGATFELRPISFVRAGGLTFDCSHAQAA